MKMSEDKKEEYINSLILEIKSHLFFPLFLNYYSKSVIGQYKYKLGEDLSYLEPNFSSEKNNVEFSFAFKNSEVWDFFHPKDEDGGGLQKHNNIRPHRPFSLVQGQAYILCRRPCHETHNGRSKSAWFTHQNHHASLQQSTSFKRSPFAP